ncbi:plasmamembrane proton-efflux P-type ATPase [Acanthamoeba castellanii str. Neff]|uniref:Plasma membrane ATPase n=2 Tax=Acanthamoeba castellanii (strain ATCC 30010 / Neff) TaxID=1257118 RepID=L8GE59_ACACF|nr:plasmamembrane proton-efflux P-type ATPase [Acanthamoeba castellanii str. Neff]ELR11003.1 plasmamembrane proton-efflux P-type ATPase [Acanthamoeba castellanii str. Neff]
MSSSSDSDEPPKHEEASLSSDNETKQAKSSTDKKKKSKGKHSKNKDKKKGKSSSDEESSDHDDENPQDKTAARSAKFTTRVDEVLAGMGAGNTRDGLTDEEAAKRLLEFGPNALPTKKESLILKFLYFFWNPLSWAMEFAALLSFVLVDYVDGILITALLLLNACIGFYEDYSSGNAVAALQSALAPTCKCLRNGEVVAGTASVGLVPGDVVLLRLGDVVPADCFILDDGDSLKIDQSSLTGESIPVDRFPGDEIYSGSIVKQGEMKAIVHATGLSTFFGKAADLVNRSEKKSHIHLVLKSIAYFCIIFIMVGVVAELITQFAIRDKPCTGVSDGDCAPLNNILVLVVGGLPIAMPTVLSVTMALGASALAKKKAIVSRLTVVEEIAGMEILCSDKTGTLTKNELSVKDPVAYVGDLADVIFDAALAAKPENGDAIDMAMVGYLTDEQREQRKKFNVLHFHPFDPVGKKTVAKLQSPDGEIFHATKGAPQVILNLSENKKKIKDRVMADIETLGKAGYRTLGVAISDEHGKKWTMTGLIPMFDPPRDDTADMIAKTEGLGVGVKMITGDHLTIAKETAKLLGMGSNIFPAAYMKDEAKARNETGMSIYDIVCEADGFAEVFPEDKYTIVEYLQRGSRIVGMTGDGVNDAPALKKANIGIAVSGATDAARGASDIVLAEEGLSVIVDAILGSRKIFQRMKNYCMYSISVCVRIVLTFGILTLAYDWYFPTIGCVLLAIFNDGSMLTISKDKVKPSKEPEHWNLLEIFGTAIVLGTYLTISTIVLFHLAVYTDSFERWFGLPHLTAAEARGLIYLQVSVSGLSTVFVTRTHGLSWLFWRERPGLAPVIAFIIAQTAATILCAYGLNGFPDDKETDFEGAGWWYVLVGWIWCIIWFPVMDILKIVVRSVMKGEIFLFKHKLSLHFQLVHGHPYHGQAAGNAHPDEWEEHVVTAGDLAHIPQQLKSKMMAKFKHSEDGSDDESAKNGAASGSSSAVPSKRSSSNNLTRNSASGRKASGLSKSLKPEEKKLKKHSDESDATSDD